MKEALDVADGIDELDCEGDNRDAAGGGAQPVHFCWLEKKTQSWFELRVNGTNSLIKRAE